MAKVDVEIDLNGRNDPNGGRGYFLVESSNGLLHCSCGRPLKKLDERTYVCPGGYPKYSFDQGDVQLDKFGNLRFRVKDHREDKQNKKKVK